MAQNKIVFEVIASEKGLRLVTKDVENLGRSHTKTKKQIDETSKATGELNYRLNQGVTGVSSAARSFSKLNQAIGSGPNGLVGAYATLAANIFALSAAFNALREAAQVEQVLRGLETQGARTGRTLTLAAKQLQEVTGFAISIADSMRSTALIASAGFGTEEISKIGEVATNAALALGRNVPDALDRLTKGVTKLEPELLDELGLMTKLTEASAKYARENNKTVNSLSSFEKRQAFLNAILEEGQLKFGGIREEIGVNPYDQLAASFDNLTKEVLGFVNILGEALATLGAINPATLGGALLLFGSTISRQLIPSLYEMSDNAIKSRDALLEQAKGAKAAAAEQLKLAQAQQQSNLTNLRNLRVTKDFPKAFKDKVELFKEGTKEAQIFDREINRLNSSLRIRERQLTTRFAGTDQEDAKRQAISSITATRDQLIKLKEAELDANNTIITSTQRTRQATSEYYALKKAANAQEIRATAVALAGQGELRASWKALTASVREYSIAVALARRAEGTGITPVTKALDSAKIAAFAAGTAIRQFGAALLNYIPYIGLISVGVGIAKEAYKSLVETEESRVRQKAFEDLNEVITSTEGKLKELSRAEESLASAALVTTQTLNIQGNTIVELTEATLKSIQEIETAVENAAKGKDNATFFEAIFGTPEDLASYITGLDRSSQFIKGYAQELEALSQLNQNGRLGVILQQAIFGDVIKEQDTQVSKAIDQLSEAIGEDLSKAFVDAYGGAERLRSTPALKEAFLKDVKERYEGVSTSVKQLEEAFKQADIASQDFINSVGQSTRYDKLLKSFESINDAILEIPNAVTSADLNNLLTGVGPDTARFLSADTQALIENYNINRDIVNTFKEKVSTGKAVTAEEIEQNYWAKANLAQQNRLLSGLRQEFLTIESRLKQAQEQERLGKARVAALNTELQVYSEIFNQSEIGTREKLKRENEVLDIQIAQNNVQKSFNSSLIATTEIRQQAIEQELKRLEILKDVNIVEEENLLLQLRAAALNAGILADELEARASIRKLTQNQQEALDNYTTVAREIDLLEKKNDLLKEQRKNEQYIRDAKAANNALDLLNQQLSDKRLTTAQIESKAQTARIKVLNAERQAIFKNQQAFESIIDLNQRYLDTLSGASKAPFYEVQQLTRDLERDRREVVERVTREVAESEAQINELVATRNAATSKGDKAAATAIQSVINSQEKLLSQKRIERDLDIQALEIRYKLAIAEKVALDARTEGLEIQQKALEALNKYVDLQNTSLSQEQEIRGIIAETAAIKRNSPLSEKAKQALEYQTLREQLSAAYAQLDIKKAGIELEYELLEAKRQLLIEELKVRSKFLPENDPARAQIEASIANLSEQTYEGLKRIALENEDRAIRLLEAKVQKAQATLLNIGSNTTFFDKLLGAVDDAALVLNSFNPANDINTANNLVVDSPVVVAQKELTTSVIELTEVNRELADQLKAASQQNSSTLASLPSLINRNTPSNVELRRKPGAGRGNELTEAFAAIVQENIPGFNRFTAFNDKFHRNRGGRHPRGEAFDFTINGGSSSQVTRLVQQLAEEFGYQIKILDEYKNPSPGATAGHIHVSVISAIKQGFKEVAQSNANNEEIVVTAKKQEPTAIQSLAAGSVIMQPFIESLQSLGPNGETTAAAVGGLFQIGIAIAALATGAEEGGASFRNLASIANQTLATVSAISQSATNAKISNIDREIAAEQKRDGQSSKSVAKLQELEKKKDQIAKKQFNLNKKLSLAQAVIATATGVAEALKYGPIAGPILAALVGALGAAQIAIIAGSSYQSADTSAGQVQKPSAFSIGKRENTVDLAKGLNPNAGGESGFLRGSSGYGSNAFNYNTIGSPYGGRLDRGYGNRGFLVGEKGVERIEPEVPLKVTPNSQLKETGTPINATFNVNALDSRGVEEVLISQKGNIIKMLRDAANSTGEGFLEDVDVNVYTSPNVSRI